MSASTERVASSASGGSEEHLRAEIYRLQQQVHELSRPKPAEDSVAAPEKSGYLFKWQDRSIGWGGTKWGLRYVRLENGRLSYYRTHEERSPRYVLTLKDCAVRDDGSKVNRRRNVNKKPSSEDASDMEVGSHFYVFSVYQPSSKVKKTEVNIFGGDDVKYKYEDEIIPLLRFSTQSQAEKNQWIELISQSCAFCDSEEFDRQSSANQKDERETKSHEGHGRNKGGTLSKLVFEEVEPRSIARKPSGFKLKEMGENFRTKTKDEKAARSNNIQYPPSKPMHRQSSPSYLSKESAHNQNYRGFFNLGMIVLVVSNYRLLIEAVRKHGFIWNELTKLNHDYMKASLSDKLFLFPFVSGISFVQIIIFQTYVIETLLGRHIVCERLGMILHFVNTNLSLGVVCAIVWHLIDSPFVGAGLVMQATVTWLKLISYVHANQDYRLTNSHGTTLAMVKDLDDEDARVRYPENVTLGDIYYFWFAPTLTYQIAFPRVPFVRWSRVLVLTFQLFLSTTLAAFLAMQVVKPNLENLVMDLEENSGEVRTSVIGEYILKLSITVTYIWLLGFFAFFHCFMNICAETLRFGDRGDRFSSITDIAVSKLSLN